MTIAVASFMEQQIQSATKKGVRRLLDRAAMLVSYEAYVRGSTDNICTMVISLLDNECCCLFSRPSRGERESGDSGRSPILPFLPKISSSEENVQQSFYSGDSQRLQSGAQRFCEERREETLPRPRGNASPSFCAEKAPLEVGRKRGKEGAHD